MGSSVKVDRPRRRRASASQASARTSVLACASACRACALMCCQRDGGGGAWGLGDVWAASAGAEARPALSIPRSRLTRRSNCFAARVRSSSGEPSRRCMVLAKQLFAVVFAAMSTSYHCMSARSVTSAHSRLPGRQLSKSCRRQATPSAKIVPSVWAAVVTRGATNDERPVSILYVLLSSTPCSHCCTSAPLCIVLASAFGLLPAAPPTSAGIYINKK